MIHSNPGDVIMKIKIGLVEIVDPTMDELHELIERYGGDVEVSTATTGGSAQKDRRVSGANGNGTASPADRVVLERLVHAGTAGVPTQEVGEVLSRRGKAIRRGLISWAQRIGLVQEGTRRGVRLKPSLIPVAEKLLASM
jgi:hypothetical protein